MSVGGVHQYHIIIIKFVFQSNVKRQILSITISL